MKVYLVQHGIPKSEQEDPQRPLSLEGRAEARKMAEHLDSKGFTVKAIYHSPKLRARETAEIFAEVLRPETLEEAEGLKPLDEPGLWAEKLNKQSREGDIMLVGHLPHLQKLASLLLVKDPERSLVAFRQAGVVCLEKTDTDWLLRWALVPELL